MRKKQQIRSGVGTTGMLIYTPDQEQVCIAYNVDGNQYTLTNMLSFLWDGKEELFRLTYFDEYTEKEMFFVGLRLLIEFMGASFLPTLLTEYIPIRQLTGLYFFLFAVIYIFEFAFLKGIHRKKVRKVEHF